MASKFLFLHTLLALALFAVQLDAGGSLPVVRFFDAVSSKNPAPINLRIKAGGEPRGSAQLNSGQDYQIKVEIDDVHFVIAMFGLRFTSFHAYEPARDKGRAAVYWRAGDAGFYISHDKTHWKMVAPWESE